METFPEREGEIQYECLPECCINKNSGYRFTERTDIDKWWLLERIKETKEIETGMVSPSFHME